MGIDLFFSTMELYEKPLAELTRLELANLIGTTKAVRTHVEGIPGRKGKMVNR